MTTKGFAGFVGLIILKMSHAGCFTKKFNQNLKNQSCVMSPMLLYQMIFQLNVMNVTQMAMFVNYTRYYNLSFLMICAMSFTHCEM